MSTLTSTRVRIAGLLLALLPGSAWSATYHVSQAGNNSNSCSSAQSTTPTSQKRSIAAGVACLSPGDTLLIHGGTYTGSDDVIDTQTFQVPSGTSWANPVTIAGAPGESVTLRPPANVSGIRLSSATASFLVFQDFTIDMANTGAGGDADGIYVYRAHHNRFLRLEVMHGAGFGVHYGDETPFNEMVECRIHDVGLPGSSNTEGHGLYITGSDNLFERNHVYNNQGIGFNMYNNHGPRTDPSRNIIRNNRIYGNGRHGPPAFGIVVAWGDGNEFTNNLIYGNEGGIQIYTLSTNTLVYHNTIYQNGVENGIVLQYHEGGHSIRNNIVFGNNGNIVDLGGTGVTVVDHNLDTDPGFTDAGAADFSLRVGSPAIDVGAPIAAVTNDFAYTPRPQGGGHDIGAYEAIPRNPGGPAPPSGLRVSP